MKIMVTTDKKFERNTYDLFLNDGIVSHSIYPMHPLMCV